MPAGFDLPKHDSAQDLHLHLPAPGQLMRGKTAHCTLRTVHCRLRTTHYALFTAHYALHTAHYALRTAQHNL